MQLPSPSGTVKIKQVWVLLCHKNNLKDTAGTIIQALGLDMTSWLLVLGLVESTSPLSKGQVVLQVTKCSTSRILFPSITSHHPRTTGSLVMMWDRTPLGGGVQSSNFTTPSHKAYVYVHCAIAPYNVTKPLTL